MSNRQGVNHHRDHENRLEKFREDPRARREIPTHKGIEQAADMCADTADYIITLSSKG